MRSRQRAVIHGSSVAAQHRQTKARYESLVERCREKRVRHEQLITLLQEHRGVVIRRIQVPTCDLRRIRRASHE